MRYWKPAASALAVGRTESKHLGQIAPRVGMSYEDLMAMGTRIASTSGVTLGTSRHVVYLLACSGRATRGTLEAQAALATSLARQQRLSDREAVIAVLAQVGTGVPAGTRSEASTGAGAASVSDAAVSAGPPTGAGAASLKDC